MIGDLRNYTCLFLLLTLSVTISAADWEDAPVEDTSKKGCPAGHVPNLDDSCQDCAQGSYADLSVQQCPLCPLNTYSDKEANANCTACPGNKKTLFKGTQSVDDCFDICEIPATMNAYYEKYATNEPLAANDRVKAGEKIVLQCRDRNYKVAKTDYSRLTISCTATFNTIDLPNTCVGDGETGDKNGMICYDSCYKETDGEQTRFVKLVGGGTVIVDSCPLAECEGDEDICVSVSYTDTFKNVNRVHFSCQTSSKFDTEICTSSGASKEEIENEKCKVQRCTTERCNNPEAVKTTSSSTKLSTSIFTIFISILFIMLL